MKSNPKLAFQIIISIIILFSGCASSQDMKHTPGKPYHHIEGGFRNPQGSVTNDYGFTWNGYWFNATRIFVEPFGPVLSNDFIIQSDKAIKDFISSIGQDSITWFGHMTTILRLDDQLIAYDPWFTNWVGPIRRETPPAFSITEIPQMDVIVISHNHREHLDIATLEKFPNPDKITVITTLGVSQYFSHINFKNVIELDWYQSKTVKNIKYTALPVVHKSQRGLFDVNETLWAGWSIENSSGKKLFFAEAEYGEIYKEIGKDYGPFDIALISAGGYLPRENNKGIHCVPSDCVQIGIDIKAKNLIPIHWGTLNQSAEEFSEPGPLFRKIALDKGVSEENIWMLKIGETRIF